MVLPPPPPASDRPSTKRHTQARYFKISVRAIRAGPADPPPSSTRAKRNKCMLIINRRQLLKSHRGRSHRKVTSKGKQPPCHQNCFTKESASIQNGHNTRQKKTTTKHRETAMKIILQILSFPFPPVVQLVHLTFQAFVSSHAFPPLLLIRNSHTIIHLLRWKKVLQ